MGLFDKFKKNKKDVQNETTNVGIDLNREVSIEDKSRVSEYEKNARMHMNQIEEIEKKVKELESSPGSVMLRNMVADSAREFLIEGEKRHFSKKYVELEMLRAAISSGGKFKAYSYELYLRLLDDQKRILFLPYLVEKKELNLLNAKEKEELAKFDENAKNFNQSYLFAAGLLHGLGVIDLLDESVFRFGYDKHNEILPGSFWKREVTKSIGDVFVSYNYKKGRR